MPQSNIASKSFYHDIDLKKNKLLNAKLQPLTTAERIALSSSYNAADKGILVYDTTELKLFVWNGNIWEYVSLTDNEYAQIYEAYNKIVDSVSITRTETSKSIVLTYRDNLQTIGTWQDGFIYSQTIPSAIWTVVHNLGKYPAVSIVDSANSEVIGEVVYNSNNQLTVSFSAAFSGKAFLN